MRGAGPSHMRFSATHSGNRQSGLALIVLLTLIGVSAVYVLITQLNSAALSLSVNSHNTDVLNQAKQGLIAFATGRPFTTSTRRPGDLPCPDTWPKGDPNEGIAGALCASNAIGRLPWKTLGLPDLRDASGERLWYAVSVNYQNNPRTAVLNSYTGSAGTITVRDSGGRVINNASAGTGVVAVIIAPGNTITRQDGLAQNRSTANYNLPQHYLDIAFSEDNATFSNGSGTNGFIQGAIKGNNGAVIVNDSLITLGRSEMMHAIEQRVLAEVVAALNNYYCGEGKWTMDRGTRALSCIAAGGARVFPRPASFLDPNCLLTANPTGRSQECQSSNTAFRGRIPGSPQNVGPGTGTSAFFSSWNTFNITNSILREYVGVAIPGWFQFNGWRELIYYEVSPACTDANVNCVSGSLTLNTSGTSLTLQKVVVVLAGNILTTQSRTTTADRTSETNYLEGENFSPLDSVYTQGTITPAFNDVVLSIR